MSNCEEYLRELASAVEKYEPLVVEEARAHLEEAVQARIELGMGQEEAEREALAAFGSTTIVVAPFSEATEVRRRRLGTIFAALFLLGFVPTQVLWRLQPGWLLMLLVARYAHACWHVRRPMRVSIVASLFTSIFVPTMYVVGLSNHGFGDACRELLYRWPKAELAELGWFHPNWSWVPYAQGVVEAAYEQRFALGALLIGTLGVDFIFGAAGAFAAGMRRRRKRAAVV